MMTNTKFILTGLILACFINSSCEKEQDPAKKLDSFSILYSKGSSWVNYSYKAKIDQDGLLQIEEVDGLTKSNRKSVYHLDDNDLLLINEKLTTVLTIDISNQYGFDNKNAPTDLPVTTMVYTTNIKSDSTSLYFPKVNEVPVQFDSFLEIVEQIILKKDSLKKK